MRTIDADDTQFVDFFALCTSSGQCIYIYIYISSIVIIELVSVFSCIAYNTIFDQASAASMALLVRR